VKFQKDPEGYQPTQRRSTWGAMPKLPLDRDVLLYPRVSQPGQLKNVSAELQAREDGELVRMARHLGWLLEGEWEPGKGIGRIRQFPQDMAKSARLRMEDRPGFKLMLQAIVAGEGRAVMSVDVDRLFRDKYGSESGRFIEMCERYQVIVITPTFIYDFHDPTHIKLFKEAVARAWDYMQYQVYDRMIYHQKRRAASGGGKTSTWGTSSTATSTARLFATSSPTALMPMSCLTFTNGIVSLVITWADSSESYGLNRSCSLTFPLIWTRAMLRL
jgi:hypothetical protein